MASLVQRSALEGLLPATLGRCTLSEEPLAGITSIMPRKGQAQTVSAALEAARGLALPEPGQAVFADDALCIWTGPDQAFLLGRPLCELAGASLTDQSDGWAALRLEGGAGADVLARLVAIDMRLAAFPVGRTARTLLGHMQASITRVDEWAFLILVFRSMAASAVHDLTEAMRSVAARDTLRQPV